MLLLVNLYRSKTRNRQKDHTKLVDMQGQDSANKDYFNILKVRDTRQDKKKTRVHTEKDNKKIRDPAQKTTGAHTR